MRLGNLAKYSKDPRIVGLVIFGIIALLVTWSAVKTVQTNFELDKEISVAKQRNEVAALKNENLKLKNTYYESDQYLELAARRQFGKAAPGEKLYVVPKAAALARTTEMPKTEVEIVEENSQPKSKFGQNLQAWREFLLR